MHVNLLTDQTRRRGIIRRSIKFWGRIWLVIIVLGSGALYWRYSVLQDDLSRIDVRLQNIEPVRLARQRANELCKEIDHAKSQHKLISENLPTDTSLQLVSLLSECVDKLSGDLYLSNLSLTQRSQTKQDKSKPVAQSSNSESVLNLSGIAMDEQAVAQLIQHLRESTALTEIELRSMSYIKLNFGSACQFQIDCKF